MNHTIVRLSRVLRFEISRMLVMDILILRILKIIVEQASLDCTDKTALAKLL